MEESECHNEAETRITKPSFESEVGGDSGKKKENSSTDTPRVCKCEIFVLIFRIFQIFEVTFYHKAFRILLVKRPNI